MPVLYHTSMDWFGGINHPSGALQPQNSCVSMLQMGKYVPAMVQLGCLQVTSKLGRSGGLWRVYITFLGECLDLFKGVYCENSHI